MAVAFFVTPHGFGHAARACAVIEELSRRHPSLRFHVFTTVPRWFFAESLSECFEYHRCDCDVGLVQRSPLEEDMEATVAALAGASWRDSAVVEGLARKLASLGCSLVIADISPLGLRVARRAGLPSVLVENFTWDWIYDRLENREALALYSEELAAGFRTPDLHIQTRPVCQPMTGAIEVDPVARTPRCSRLELRQRLGIADTDPMVLVSMGGVAWDYGPLQPRARGDGPWFVVPGGARTEQRVGRTLLVPFHSPLYHPDLVNAADVVVGKLGYSTVAEAFRAGAAFAWIARPRFPESEVLARFVERHLNAREVSESTFRSFDWGAMVEGLTNRDRRGTECVNGAAHAAEAIIERFSSVFQRER